MTAGTETVEISSADYADTLRRFVSGEKLIVIPARRNAKLVAFAWIVERFDVGVRYREADVNAAIKLANDDFATIRRGLYDEHFMDRVDGMYWRTPETARLRIIGTSAGAAAAS